MITPLNILPQVSQLAFNPTIQPPQGGAFQAAAIGQQIMQVPLQTAQVIASIETQKANTELQKQQIDLAIQKFNFLEQQYQNEQEKYLDQLRGGALKTADQIFGIQFTNPEDAKNFTAALENEGIDKNTMASLVDADQVQVKDFYRKLNTVIGDPVWNRKIEMETRLDALGAEIAKNPSAFDTDAYFNLVERVQAGKDVSLRELSAANALKPKDMVAELHKKYGQFKNIGLTEEAGEWVVQHGVNDGYPEAVVREVIGLNIDFDALALNAAQILFDDDYAEGVGMVRSMFEEEYTMGGKEAVKALNAKFTALQVSKKLEEVKNKEKILLEHEKGEIKKQQEALKQSGGNVIENGKLQYDWMSYDNKVTKGIIEKKAKVILDPSGYTQLDKDGVPVAREVVDADGNRALTDEPVNWADMTPDEANAALTLILMETKGEGNLQNAVARMQRSFDNEMPINLDELGYFPVYDRELKLHNLASFNKDPNKLYLQDPITNRIATNDARVAVMLGGKDTLKKSVHLPNGQVETLYTFPIPESQMGATNREQQTGVSPLEIIGSVESANFAGGAYNAYNFGKSGDAMNNPLGIKLTDFTIGDVLDIMGHSDPDMRDSEKLKAVGAYQVTYPTLKSFIEKYNVPTDQRFDENMQDFIAKYYLAYNVNGNLRKYIRNSNVSASDKANAIKEIKRQFNGLSTEQAETVMSSLREEYQSNSESLEVAIKSSATDSIPLNTNGVFAFAGDTGSSSGPHIHLEVWQDGKNVTQNDTEAMNWLLAGGRSLNTYNPATGGQMFGVKRGERTHKGVDISVPRGTPLMFSPDVTVKDIQMKKQAGNNVGYGFYTEAIVEHNDTEYKIVLGHLEPELPKDAVNTNRVAPKTTPVIAPSTGNPWAKKFGK